jgi:hypothetical protein
MKTRRAPYSPGEPVTRSRAPSVGSTLASPVGALGETGEPTDGEPNVMA